MMISFLYRVWDKILDVLFPPLCLACKKHLSNNEEKSEFLCDKCRKQIEIHNSFFCPECRRRLPEAEKSCHPETKFILAAAASYENPVIRELIHILKYQDIKDALIPLTKIINSYIDKIISHLSLVISHGHSVIIPIPLHFQKEKERGFNQAMLIARAVAGALHDRVVPGLKIETNNLLRIKSTESQTGVGDYEKRTENVAGCFNLKEPERIKNKNILIIDDVFTSGATMREAVKVLKEAGARKIIGFVIAKA